MVSECATANEASLHSACRALCTSRHRPFQLQRIDPCRSCPWAVAGKLHRALISFTLSKVKTNKSPNSTQRPAELSRVSKVSSPCHYWCGVRCACDCVLAYLCIGRRLAAPCRTCHRDRDGRLRLETAAAAARVMPATMSVCVSDGL
jgi:hypothetical protein